MKKILIISFALLGATAVWAKDLKTIVVTTQPEMECHSCEKKIKENMRFEKGVKSIETNIGKQEVTLVYDADKITLEKLLLGFTKFGYTAKVVSPPTPVKGKEEKKATK